MWDAGRAVVCGGLVGIWIVVAPLPARAASGDCAQPQTNGSQPTATDCLAILSVAVGLRTCDPFAACVCAPKGTLPTTATDALVCLSVAVGGPAPLACPCETPTTTTTIPPFDVDGDGWTPADGDCCDTPSDGCTVPALVNPGAFDFAGDDIDDDCDGTADNGGEPCDAGLVSDSNDATDYAAALDLCSLTTESPSELAQKRYGLIAATLSLASGTGSPAAVSRAIRPGFGGVAVQQGSSMVVLSTGSAASPSQVNPGFVAFEPGNSTGTSSAVPADWLAANAGSIPTAPGCPAITDTTAHDPVMLTLRVRVPTNAQSFRLVGNFLTAEFPEWVCSAFNDQLVVLVDSTAATNPADKNLAVYESPIGAYPLGGNLAYGDTGLFGQCRNGIIACGGALESSITTCIATTELAGSGLDLPASGCQADDTVGGGTGWLTISGNVVPGEVMVLRIAIWDSGDSAYDSLVILDNLQWSPDPATAGTTL